MQAYGRKKTHTHVPGHQECGICHPVQKSKTKRARRSNKRDAARDLDLFYFEDIWYPSDL